MAVHRPVNTDAAFGVEVASSQAQALSAEAPGNLKVEHHMQAAGADTVDSSSLSPSTYQTITTSN